MFLNCVLGIPEFLGEPSGSPMSCVLQGEVHVRGGSVAKQFTTPWAGGLPGRSGGEYGVHTEQTPLFFPGSA